MKSTVLIHDFIESYGEDQDKVGMMRALMAIRVEVRAEVKRKCSAILSEAQQQLREYAKEGK